MPSFIGHGFTITMAFPAPYQQRTIPQRSKHSMLHWGWMTANPAFEPKLAPTGRHKACNSGGRAALSLLARVGNPLRQGKLRPYLLDDHVLPCWRRYQGQVIAMPADVLGDLVDLGLGSSTTQHSAHQSPDTTHYRCLIIYDSSGLRQLSCSKDVSRTPAFITEVCIPLGSLLLNWEASGRAAHEACLSSSGSLKSQ